MLMGPPDAPCVAKWLMLGISIPSMKKRFSAGPPPRTIRSFLYPMGENATPGKERTMREMSRLAPGIFSMSCMPMTYRLTGLSALLFISMGPTEISPSSRRSSSNSISTKGVVAEIMYSAVSVALYPMLEAKKRCIPGLALVMRKLPMLSVAVQLVESPSIYTWQ